MSSEHCFLSESLPAYAQRLLFFDGWSQLTDEVSRENEYVLTFRHLCFQQMFWIQQFPRRHLMLNLFAAYLSISVVVNQGRQKLRVGRKAFIASTQLLDCSSSPSERAGQDLQQLGRVQGWRYRLQDSSYQQGLGEILSFYSHTNDHCVLGGCRWLQFCDVLWSSLCLFESSAHVNCQRTISDVLVIFLILLIFLAPQWFILILFGFSRINCGFCSLGSRSCCGLGFEGREQMR